MTNASRDGNDQSAPRHAFTVPPAQAGRRLDVWLTGNCAGFSRSRIQALIRAGQATVNDRRVKEHYSTKAGDQVTLVIPPPVISDLKPEAIALDILYEDADLIVIDKPAGLVVHPAAGHASGTLVHALLHHCRDLSGIGGTQRPGIVHRLDKGTSGVLVAAKSARAHAGLVNQFKQRLIHKEYLALVWGAPAPASGIISAPIGRHKTERKKMSANPKIGRPAVTRYETLQRLGELSLLRLFPETGRTHQIRVHLAHIGHAIVGDPVYGRRSTQSLPASRRIERPLLHAAKLSFIHPATSQELSFAAPPPADFTAIVEALRAHDIK
jgi:23S rRNA pseudouridine1911/1915/1917 synthase